MPRKYPAEVRRQVIELARSGTKIAQLALSDLKRLGAEYIDVNRGADPEVAGEQRGRALEDPAFVDRVETLQQAVVGNLPLQLGQRPFAVLRHPFSFSVRARRNAAGLA